MAFLQPQPTLEISTGATNRNTGDYAYTISGVDPAQVYETAGKLTGKMSEQVGPAVRDLGARLTSADEGANWSSIGRIRRARCAAAFRFPPRRRKNAVISGRD